MPNPFITAFCRKPLLPEEYERFERHVAEIFHRMGMDLESDARRRTTSPQAVLKILAEEFGVRTLLHEGGPTVFGEFLSAGAVDELFLTLAPQVAGRDQERPRPGFAGVTSFLPETAPWFSLRSVKQGSSDLLFLRYAATGRTA